ncbi:MAG: hypothetical protein ACLP53_18550, partial [Isosphaeraceae bacterium]
MMIARAHLVDPSVTRWYHRVTRCVRRAFLLGEGMHDRKGWIEHRLEERAEIGTFSRGGFPGGSLWTIPLETCSIVGELTPIGIDGGSPMSTITQRIASAFVVLCG